jgi:hypothetical protein
MYDDDGGVGYLYEREYDENNNEIKTSKLGDDGQMKVVFDTEFDENGNSIKGTNYSEDGTVSSWYENEYIEIPVKVDYTEYESPLGYTIEYDESMYTLTSTSDLDTFEYTGGWDLDAPVFVAVQLYTDMDAQTVADGIVLQIGRDDVTAEEGSFGNYLEGLRIDYDEELDDVKLIHDYFIVPSGNNCFVMEAQDYYGIPGYDISDSLEAILDSFTPIQ